jgi:hypothetical protein
MNTIGKKIFLFLASYGFATVLLFFLLLLTLFGTLEQVNLGLFEAQKKYFESIFLVHHLFGVIPLPLPGAYLLMGLLFVNLVCGGIIRARKNWRQPGMLITHGGILFMLVAGFVTYHYSISGHMTLYENEQAAEFQSYYEWEIGITKPGETQEWIVPGDRFTKLRPGETKTFAVAGLPVELTLRDYARNTTPQRVGPTVSNQVNGFNLVSMPLDKTAERNIAGAYATLRDPNTGESQEGLLWGLAQAPWNATIGGEQYLVDLRHKRYPVPFTITLDKFTRELHPGTQMAASFSSDVTQMEETGATRQIHIRMNEPLRDRGFTFFQASWGPQGAGPNDRLFSTFAVVNNPADQWPLYACYVITVGLLIHFGQKMVWYIKRENRRRAA